jgi:membrane protein
MTAVADQPGKPSKLAELRRRHEWLDHLLRAAQSYNTNHGDHYAGAITYFSVLALFPLLMVAFAVAALILRANPKLIVQLEQAITQAVPGGMGATIGRIIDQAINSAGTVGVLGLLIALYSGLGWMTNMREALSEQWGQRAKPPAFLRRLASDLAALCGLGVALALSLGISAIGGLAGGVVRWLGLPDSPGSSVLVRVIAILIALLANALVILWVIARLPREPVTWRSAAKAALLGAVGFEVIKQVMVFYLAAVTNSPAGVLFGPVLGLMVFIFTVSRFLLFLAAWAATARENRVEEPPPVPGPAVIRAETIVRPGAGPAEVAGLVGAGAVAGLVGALLIGHRRRWSTGGDRVRTVAGQQLD